MPDIEANGITLAYETFGERSGRPLILIMGLASQMIGWPDDFCRMLAESGHFVVRFDNRDTGFSTKMAHLGVPDIDNMIADYAAGRPVTAPYLLSDMSGDVVGLLDGLGLERAHVCGLSMGGMIGQVMAVAHPARVISLISISSTTSEKDLPNASPEATRAILSPPPVGRQAYIDHMVWVYRAFSGGSDKFDADCQKGYSSRAYDRMFYPIGFTRQMAAILASGGRRRMLKGAGVPTLVIQGTHDSLTPLAHGQDIARSIPGARLRVVEGLGHGMAYPDLWPEIVAAITGHTKG